MSRTKVKSITIIVSIIVFISVLTAYLIYPMETLADQTTFMITVLSLVISLLAFIIAILTYTSIDSVDNVTRMDGNVLENENYVTSLTDILDEYSIQDPQETRDAIFKDLHRKFSKESKTAVAFANNLQYFIDLIVIFPLFYKTSDEKQDNLELIQDILKRIEKRKKDLLEVSRGDLVLIEETVKLIHAVMSYQQFTATDRTDNTIMMLSVRGSMLKNGVTRTVYYNYLGLFYNKKAMKFIRKMIGIDNFDLLSIQSLRIIYNQSKDNLKEEDRELLSIYLIESLNAFDQALSNSEADMMWKGFIKYNKARTTFFYETFFEQDKYDDWEMQMDEAINTRMQLNYLINDLLHEEKSYLQEEFIYQEDIARLVKINIKIATNEKNYRVSNKIDDNNPYIEGLLNDPIIANPYEGPSDKIRNYRNAIMNELE